MTRQEQLDAINMKIARTHQSDEGTGYFLPVMIGDILYYVDRNCFWEDDYKSGDGHRRRDMDGLRDCIVTIFYLFIRGQHLPLHEQDDDCISYIYSLL